MRDAIRLVEYGLELGQGGIVRQTARPVWRGGRWGAPTG